VAQIDDVHCDAPLFFHRPAHILLCRLKSAEKRADKLRSYEERRVLFNQQKRIIGSCEWISSRRQPEHRKRPQSS
jgi:hypothetical protein